MVENREASVLATVDILLIKISMKKRPSSVWVEAFLRVGKYRKIIIDKLSMLLLRVEEKICLYIRASFSDFSRALIISVICQTHAFGVQTR